MLGRAFSVRELAPWVLSYAVLGFVPRFVKDFVPDETSQTVVVTEGNRVLRLYDVFLWLPNTFAIAAVITLLIGLTIAVFHVSIKGMIGEEGPTSATGRCLVWSFTTIRTLAGWGGIILIVVAIVGVWLSIMQNAATEWIDTVIAGIGAGIGLATGSAYYTTD